MKITQKLLPIETARRSGTKNNGIKFLVMHDTGNPGTNAQTNVNYYIKSAQEMSASAHYFVDDTQILQCIPDDEKAWHVRYNVGLDKKKYGVHANDCAIGVELCYGKTINNEESYKNYVYLIAELCKKFKLNPDTDLTSHAVLDPSRRTDPFNAFSKMNKTWDQFIDNVKAVLWTSINKPSASPKTLKFSRDAYYGTQGEFVKDIQEFLRVQGFFTYPINTGAYWSATFAAVYNFQRKYNLTPDGKWGEKTRDVANTLV